MASNGTPANNLMCTLRVNYEGVKYDIIIPIEVAKISNTIKGILECFGDDDGTDGNIIPILEISPDICKKVFEYCQYIHENPLTIMNVNEWNDDYEWKVVLDLWFTEYLNVPEEIMVGVINAANLLDIRSLLKMECKYVSSLIKKNKIPDELHRFFHTSPKTPTVASDVSQ